MLWIVEKDGKRRQAENRNCLVCNEEFLARKNSKKKYCSHECGCKSRQNKINLECAYCKKNYTTTPSKFTNSKSGFHFCSRRCKDNAQCLGGIQEIMPAHYGSLDSSFAGRRYLNNSENKVCEDCGNKKRYLLTVHHKDGNNKNNVDSNFEILCWNCHIKRHLKFVDGEWIYCTKSLTPRELLSDL